MSKTPESPWTAHAQSGKELVGEQVGKHALTGHVPDQEHFQSILLCQGLQLQIWAG